jgi:hypothetical protein
MEWVKWLMDTLGRIEDGPMSRRYGLMNRKATEDQLGMAKRAWLRMKKITKNAWIFKLVLMTKKNGWRRNRKQCLNNREMSGWQVRTTGRNDGPANWKRFLGCS